MACFEQEGNTRRRKTQGANKKKHKTHAHGLGYHFVAPANDPSRLVAGLAIGEEEEEKAPAGLIEVVQKELLCLVQGRQEVAVRARLNLVANVDKPIVEKPPHRLPIKVRSRKRPHRHTNRQRA